MILFIFYLLIIKEIRWSFSCNDERCSNCVNSPSHETDFYYHNCETCKEELYLLIETNNCYYNYELPGFYITSTNMFEPCSSENNCYECIDSPTKCISCLRGAEYDETSNSCIKCNTNNYMYILESPENCQMKEESEYACELKITKCTDIPITNNDYECPLDYPLLFTGELGEKECTMETYINSNHIISNQIIKTQWLNKKIQIGIDNCYFLGVSFSSENDLIIESNTVYEDNDNIYKNRYFYGIKSNGRPFFNEDGNEHKIIEDVSGTIKYESQLIKIKINTNNDNKDYYMSISSSIIEIIDIENNVILVFSKNILFGDYAWSSRINSILELNDNIYLFCLISDNNILFYKYKFYNSDLSQENSFELISFENNTNFASNSIIISCIKISTYNKIQCLYINTELFYLISLFNENDLQFIQSYKIDETSLIYEGDIYYYNYFCQCIYLKSEISIIAYVLNPDSNIIYIQTKKLIYNDESYELNNYFSNNTKIEINSDGKYSFSSYYYISKLVRLDDNRFCLITTSKSFYDFYIIVFDFYNSDLNLYIRYYHINLKLIENLRQYKYLWAVNYNGFLGLIYTSKKLSFYDSIQYFSIFSYINSRDSELITLDKNTILLLSNYINEDDIENNLFGVILYGIKILSLPNNIGIFYISENKNDKISENEILMPDDIIHFIFDFDNLIKGDNIYIIEIAGAVKEPSYEEFNKYPEKTEYYGDETQESYYNPRTFVGKTGFYKFKIPTSLIEDNENICLNNCRVCYNDLCLKCNENFNLNEESHICIFNSCHYLCQTCNNGRPILNTITLEVEDTNCETCINDYYKVINTNNCVHKDNPPVGYYLDIDHGLFLNCYINCKTCNKNKKNSTYFNCLTCGENDLFYEKSSNCLNCVYLNKYVNYFQYDCIEYIPDGYYLSDPLTKIIDKCFISCKHCNMKGNSNDHKCTECSDAYPYNYNNGQKCLDDCSKEKLYLESENKICYRDCSNNNINDKKSNYKNKCIDKNESPKNYILDEYYNYISKCNPKNEYEFNNECYKSCPDGTKIDISEKTKNLCICNNLYYLNGENYICINSKICPDHYPYLKINSKECSNCPVTYKGLCLLSCPEGTCITQINPNLAVCVDKSKETKILNGICFDDFIRIVDEIQNINSNNNIVINDYPGVSINIYQNGMISNKAFYEYSNLTFIDLGKCFNKLIEFYNLNPNDKLYILSVDSLTKMSNKSTNDFSFEIYLENGVQLKDLSICKDTTISISSPIIKEDLVNFNLAKKFNEQGYDIYNLSSEFYNDKCTSVNMNNSDIIILDRIKDIYPSNISFCSNDCSYERINFEYKRFDCICDIYSSTENNNNKKSNNIFNTNINSKELIYSFSDLNNINLDIMKCYKLLFKKEGISKNIGSYILLSILLIYIIGTFLFYFKGYNSLYNIIQSILSENSNKTKNININNKEFPKKKENNLQILNFQKSKNNINSKNSSTSKSFGVMNFTNQNNGQNKIITHKDITQNSLDIINNNIKNNINIKETEIEKNNHNFLKYNDSEINNLNYEEALKYDKRNFFQYYLSLIKKKNLILFSFFTFNDYNSLIIKICLFFFTFSMNITVNALFFNDSTMHKMYLNKGKYNLIYQLPQIIYSVMITSIINAIIKYFSLSENNIIGIKKNLRDKNNTINIDKKIKCLKIKFILFFIISFILLIFFWYYISCFCALYKATQIPLIKDTLSSFIISLIYPLFLSLLPGLLRILSLRKSGNEIMYNISRIIQII